ncbi:UNVERIFIED_CONTAM: hypothetical protein Slati_3817800 [Sesamum latifolium]|uniref:DUF4218 domain-containing protein n=1 Tax=Sesamum latifolium TaxID=2727402 RepID=A0AAW2U4E5_9LAMI
MIEYPSGVIEYISWQGPGDYYSTKKLIKDLGLPVEKIGTSRPEGWTHARRSPRILSLGTCHLPPSVEVVFFEVNYQAHDVACHTSDGGGSMCHPSDAEAWKHFDQMYLDFAEEPCNVRLGLCTDGLRLTRLIDVYLKLLIEELLQLWHLGVRTYDHGTDNEFIMRAALMDCERPTRLWNGVWMEYHRVMDVWFVWMTQGIPSAARASVIARSWSWMNVDLTLCLKRHNPVKGAEEEECEWIKGLQFPDGYASNLARCIDMMELRMHGMKSHDYHVFMQKLIPIAFREMLPEHVWSALTEVSLLFQSICSTTLDVHKLHKLENIVAIILCNLEKIFPPAFFDSMEYLIVHLLYEARVGGQCNTGGCTNLKGSCLS